MAQDINRILDSLSDYATDALDVANDKDLATLIDKLDDLADQSAVFGGEIARVLPTRIRTQVEALKNLFAQVQSVAKSANAELNNLVDFVDTIPVGQLRKKGLSLTSANVAPDAQSNTPVAPIPSVDPEAAPKSEMLKQEESLWGQLKSNFRESSRPTNGFNFSKIRESVDGLNIDFGIIDPNAEKNLSLFESIQANLPKGAGDLNSKPDPRDAEYEEYAEAMQDVLPNSDPELTQMSEAMYTSSPSIAAPIQTYNFANNAAANIDFDGLVLDESDGFSEPEPDDNNGVRFTETKMSAPNVKNYDLSEEEMAAKCVDED